MKQNITDESREEALKNLARSILELASDYDIVNYRIGDDPQDVARDLSVVLRGALYPTRKVTDEKVILGNNHVEGLSPAEYEGKFVIFVDGIYKKENFELLGRAIKPAQGEGKIKGAAYINAFDSPGVFQYTEKELKKLNPGGPD